MTNSLDRFAAGIRAVWGPLTSELVAACEAHLRDLAATPPTEPWLAELHAGAPANRELHRDPDHGFVLQAHTETAGLYRPPHDHGRAWVVYAVQRGEVEMGTYARIEGEDGRVRLVKRNLTRVRAGEAQVYLPGDIHDTRCIAGPALLFRFTERDLRKEDREERRVTRYAEQDGEWAPWAP